MGATTGISAVAAYTGLPGPNVDTLIALIPDPDTAATSGAQAGGGFLDEMSPAAATQLLVELAALKVGSQVGGKSVAYGQYTVLAADDTANLIEIVTGLADTSVAKIAVCISRAGALVAPGTITEPAAGTIRIADKAASAVGATDAYTTTAGDIVTWFAIAV